VFLAVKTIEDTLSFGQVTAS